MPKDIDVEDRITRSEALAFDELPEVDGLTGNRVLLAPGLLVRMFAASGLLLTDGSD